MEKGLQSNCAGHGWTEKMDDTPMLGVASQRKQERRPAFP